MRSLYPTEVWNGFSLFKKWLAEWNGARVHVSEYEPKQPQLESKTSWNRCTRFTICKTG
jgi:hypothetical protein